MIDLFALIFGILGTWILSSKKEFSKKMAIVQGFYMISDICLLFIYFFIFFSFFLVVLYAIYLFCAVKGFFYALYVDKEVINSE